MKRLAMTLASLALLCGTARAADPVFGPEPAHAIATDCAASDTACIDRHDASTLLIAIYLKRPGHCAQATRPAVCSESYEMAVGETPPPAPWAGLSDACTFVVRIDQGIAQLYSPRTNEHHKARALPAWKAAKFIGPCKLDSLTSGEDVVANGLPKFPWQ